MSNSQPHQDTMPASDVPGIQSFFIKSRDLLPPRIDHAEGIFLTDSDGNRYLDATSGLVAVNLGYGNKRIVEAMSTQALKANFAFPLQFESDANLELTRELAKLTGFDKSFIVSSGSEAVEASIKFARVHALARGEDSRHIVINRAPSYHGATLGALARTGDDVLRKPYTPLLDTAYEVPAPMPYRRPEGMTEDAYALSCAEALDRKITDLGAQNVLAFIMEPICGLSGGAAVAPDCYYEKVREICTRHGVLLIYDEVLTGVGRTGAFLATQHWPAGRPDIVATSKGLGAGYYPVGAMLTTADLVATVTAKGGFPHGQTYTGSPVACATALAVLQEIQDRNLLENATRMGALLGRELTQLRQSFPIVGDVRGKGMLWGLEFVSSPETREKLPAHIDSPALVSRCARQHGLLIYPRRTGGGAFGDWVLIAPPLIVTEQDIRELVDKLRRTLSDFQDHLTQTESLSFN